MNYLVLIGDIENSRRIANREIFQQKFSQALKTVQNTFQRSIVSPLTVTLGDEFQTVMDDASVLFDLTTQIEVFLEETVFRFGIGLGRIMTEINRENAIGMDGPAFHNARTAIEKARRERKKYSFYTEEQTGSQDLLLLLDWVNAGTSRWNIQKKKIRYFYAQGYNQKQIGEELNISQPAVSQNINEPFFRLVIESHKRIQQKLEHLLMDNA